MMRFLALLALLLLLATSVVANGYGVSHDDAPAGANGYGGGHDDASPEPSKGGGGGGEEEEGPYQEPAYEKPVEGLDAEYYSKTCPQMEAIVHNAVRKAISHDYTLASSLIRLFFHDFAVEGTDGSVLIDVPGQSEKYAEASRTLRGFDLIEEIKKELEAKCHATVSCADILTAAARDAATAVGVPYWSLKYGRKDGKDSIAAEADRLVPMNGQSVTELIRFFQSKGLTIFDLVVLSGAHTIGRATCGAVRPGMCARRKEGTLDRQYGDFLWRRCGAGGDGEYVELDCETPTRFDNKYYENLLHGKGLLDTDQSLVEDSRTKDLVKMFAKPGASDAFVHLFARSMRKLGEVQVLTGNEGEVRRKCSAVNY
ncbi:hypothetical protein HU200_066439 [Digitaria exilis]|uniref:Peroxidase n=1 Tax=Digitaria exilis TaxID=1010633 RepID=A0A834ZY69_9POAL|nr:hypothetical protein HU200_066439 [Digitaria exilis]